MIRLITIAFIMTVISNGFAQNGQAQTVKKTFSRETSISITIQAEPTIVWALLTNAADYPRWNPTVISIEGNIQEGEKIRLISTLDPERTFKLKVKEMIPEKKIVWGDSKGDRIYTIQALDTKSVRFYMTEKIGGLMFPLYAKYIPPFDEAFEQFAAALKKEAELIEKGKNE